MDKLNSHQLIITEIKYKGVIIDNEHDNNAGDNSRNNNVNHSNQLYIILLIF